MKEYIVQANAPETIECFDAHGAPEIVRCKDCKYVDYMYGYKKYQCPRNKRFVSEYWYCADGKRKSEDV